MRKSGKNGNVLYACPPLLMRSMLLSPATHAESDRPGRVISLWWKMPTALLKSATNGQLATIIESNSVLRERTYP